MEQIDRRLAACIRVCEGVPTKVLASLPLGAFKPYAVRLCRYGLTKRQGETLDFIKRYTADHGGTSPSLREIAAGINVTGPGPVTRFLDGLEERGYITRIKYLARSITLVHD